MTRPDLDFLAEAVDEARVAREWYAVRSAAAASRFDAELERALEEILDAPDRWPIYDEGVWHFLLRRFPYMIVYREVGTSVQIVAVAHCKRKPGYWKGR